MKLLHRTQLVLGWMIIFRLANHHKPPSLLPNAGQEMSYVLPLLLLYLLCPTQQSGCIAQW